jgi:DDB1- and CUL4-associated factor 7
LANSTILYETNIQKKKSTYSGVALLRLKWNKLDPNYVATFHQDSSKIIVLDVRVPAVPVYEFINGHRASISCLDWSPKASSYILSGGIFF